MLKSLEFQKSCFVGHNLFDLCQIFTELCQYNVYNTLPYVAFNMLCTHSKLVKILCTHSNSTPIEKQG